MLIVVGALAACGGHEPGAAPGEAQWSTASVSVPDDVGPEVLDGTLYPPGIPVNDGSAVGQTRSGWIISTTGNGEDGHVSVIDAGGRVLVEGGSVLGIGLADPSGDLAAWVESRNDGDVRHLVIVDTATGEQLERRTLDQDSVAAVHGDEVLLQGGAPGIAVYTVGGDPEPLSVDDDQVVWGYDGEHLVTGDFDHAVTVSDRDGEDAHTYQAIVGYLSPGSDKVALLGEDGVSVVDLSTGDSISLPVKDAGSHIVWTAAGDLVVRTGGLLAAGDGEEMGERYVCLGGTADCRPAPVTRPGEQTLFHPADALINYVGQLS